MSSHGGTRDDGDATEAATAPSASEPPFDLPTIGERYVILERLGAGGMGIVYAAWDRALARRVALKVVREGMEPGRFQREAQALAKLKHPNVVTVYDVGVMAHGLFIAMELVEGTSLLRWQLARPRPWRDVLGAYVAAGRGLAAAHAAALVHRDFKPENVLIGRDEVARVVDFGLVLALDEPLPASAPVEHDLSDRLTETGMIIGTPRYMAPEQSEGGVADTRSDQYSFCLALLEALSGVHPVSGDRFPAKVIGQPPARIVAALRRGLAERPAARWPSMGALLAELERPSTRGRWIAAGTGLLVAVAAVGLVRRAGDASAAACRLEGAGWSDVVEGEAIRRAFEATGAPRAATAADGALRQLAAYAGEHGAMARASCEATRIRGSQSREQHAARADCLLRHRRTLRALAGELVRPDPGIVQRAVEAAQALPPASECADPDALAARAPADPRLRPAAAALRAELDELEVLDVAGRLQVVLVRAQAAVALARYIGFAPLVADALVRLGTAYNRLDQFARSRDALEEGVFVAQAAGNDGALTRSAIVLSRVAWYADRKMDEARRWARLAAASLARLGPGPEAVLLGARLELRLSDLDRVEGRYRPAEEHARRALAVYERVQPGSRALHVARLTLASTLESQGRLDESEAVYRAALEGATQLVLGGDDLSRIYGGLGILAAKRDRPDEARGYYEKAIESATEATGPNSTLVGGYVNNLANVERSGGRMEAALEAYRRAHRIYAARVGASSPQLSGFVQNEGRTLAALGRRDEARAALKEAVALAEKQSPQGLELASGLLQLALLDLEEGNLAAAAPLARRSLELTSAIDPDSNESADALSVLAVASEESGAASFPLFQHALALLDRYQGATSVLVTRLRGELGVAQLRAGQRAAARATLEGALAMAPDAMSPRALRALARLVAERPRARALAAMADEIERASGVLK